MPVNQCHLFSASDHLLIIDNNLNQIGKKRQISKAKNTLNKRMKKKNKAVENTACLVALIQKRTKPLKTRSVLVLCANC